MGKFIFGTIFGAAVSAVVIKRKEICEAVKSIKETVEETKSEIKD